MDTHKHIWPIEKRGCFYGESDIWYTSSDTIVSRYKQHQAFFPSTNIHYWPSVRSGWLDIDHILLCNFSAQDKVEVYKNRTKEQKAHVAYLDSISGWRICFMLPLGTGRDMITINYPEIKFAVCTEHIWPISTFTLLLYRML